MSKRRTTITDVTGRSWEYNLTDEDWADMSTSIREGAAVRITVDNVVILYGPGQIVRVVRDKEKP